MDFNLLVTKSRKGVLIVFCLSTATTLKQIKVIDKHLDELGLTDCNRSVCL